MWTWLSKFLRRPAAADRLGDRGECAAAKYLEAQGFRILERQHRGHFGEVDLIAIDGDTIVFVEVKTRATTSAGDPTEAVDLPKQRKSPSRHSPILSRRCGWSAAAVSMLWRSCGMLVGGDRLSSTIAVLSRPQDSDKCIDGKRHSPWIRDRIFRIRI